jgi:serine/threonine-protein kinase
VTLEPGSLVLDRYVVHAVLGAGGMGHVYRGEHIHLGTAVALKVLSSLDVPELRTRFAREAQLMAKVRHTNVVAVLDYGFLADGSPCIAMELLEGESVDARIARAGPQPPAAVIDVLAGVLDGLAAIHAAGMVHRDLKPSNVVMTATTPEIAKVIDFGIAKPLAADSTRYTKTGALIGTPAYMSPEQLYGEPVDARSDLYAVGLIGYELLTGALPFGGNTMGEVLRRFTTPFPPPSGAGAPAGVPAALEALVMQALEIDREARPHSAAEMATALTGAGAGAGAPTAPAGRAGVRFFAAATPPPTAAAGPTEMTEAPAAAASAACSRYLVVARLPPSRLASPDDRRWLISIAGTGARPFTLGAQLWFCVQTTPSSPADAEARATALAAHLEQRYGGLARVEWSVTDETFTLSAQALSGASPLPAPLAELLDRLS